MNLWAQSWPLISHQSSLVKWSLTFVGSAYWVGRFLIVKKIFLKRVTTECIYFYVEVRKTGEKIFYMDKNKNKNLFFHEAYSTQLW
jgi:hypothetical protein